MDSERRVFERRFELIITIVHWAALAVGIVVSAVRVDESGPVIGAALLAGIYVVLMQALPLDVKQSRVMGEALALGGVAASMGAVAFTEGVDSAYLLFSITPTLFAASILGPRTGLATALLSIAGLVTVAAALEQNVLSGSLLFAAGLQLVIAVAFSQARRLYQAEEARSAALEEASTGIAARLDRLGAAHDLLLQLSGLAGDAELNPVTAARETLDDLGATIKFEAAVVAVSGDDGPVVVARHGDEPVEAVQTTFPLRVGDREVGFVLLWSRLAFEAEEQRAIRAALRALSLSFSNVLLLRDIARRAVREERIRLARELHDEIGPSLASLGLALDLALLQHPLEPELGSHLRTLRGSVESLVEEVRRTVTDLREEGRGSLRQQANALAREFDEDGDPELVVDIDERRPPRPSIAGDLAAILGEAVRNARIHSGAARIVVDAQVDHDRGTFVVSDDGRGFDPAAVPMDRFGLVGMRERAQRLGADMRVESVPGEGTTVTLRWGP